MTEAYFGAVRALGMRLIRLLALALDLPPEHFAPMFSKPMLYLRPLHYAPRKSDPKQVSAELPAYWHLRVIAGSVSRLGG